MADFSRLQLAAALLEYDNDPDDPSSSRSAQESAIFAHVRTRNAPRARTLSGFEHLRETPNILGVELPITDTGSRRGSMDPRRSLGGTRNSRGSIDVLRNPFGDDTPESEQGAEDRGSGFDDLEVDLEAWGMANILGKDKEKRPKDQKSGPRQRTQSEVLPSSQAPLLMDEFGRLNRAKPRPSGARSKSMSFGVGDEFFEAIRGAPVASEADFRRRSLGAPLDPTGRKTPNFDGPLSATRQIQSNRTPPRNQFAPSPHSIPFPSPGGESEDGNSFAVPLTTYTSKFDPKSATHGRTMSSGSLGSQLLLDQGRARTPSLGAAAFDENPLASRTSPLDSRRLSDASLVRRPMPDTASRDRTNSVATMGTQSYLDDNPFSLPPPSPSRTSRFDPKAARPYSISNASLGSRLAPEGDRMSVASGQVFEQEARPPRRYSRMDLMRPKVLIMPSPLQGTDEAPAAPQLPPGFQLTTVGPPLPPGAQSTGRPISQALPSMGGLQVPATNDSLTPNPRISMTLSQLTFRNSLMPGGRRDVAYEDIERGLRRAQEDGEQIYQEEDIKEEVAEEQKQAQGKAPGKLYGRSLMDELQARKDQMRSKQRVFTGDQRPSMMSRGQIRRASTLIDPATLQDRPQAQSLGERSPLSRRASSSSKPLLDFSGESPTSPGAADGRLGNSMSVFGVDQLWERELARLKQIQAAEKAEEEERRRVEEAKAAKKSKGKGKRKKGKNKGTTAVEDPEPEHVEAPPRPSIVSELPPTLPAIQKTTGRRPRPPIADYNSDSDSEASENEAKAKAAAHHGSADGWGSSDDEGRPKAARKFDSDSEDDVPLARQIPAIRAPSSDSEDEKPLAQVLERKSMVPDFSFGDLLGEKLAPHADEEDDTPLAIRHPRAQSIIAQSIAHGIDDDDDEKPLGLKQAQQHQEQHNMFAHQMMMQAQLRNSMAFGAPSMLSGFSPFMIPPPPAFGPAPIVPMHDAGKYHSVDQWRHNVAAE